MSVKGCWEQSRDLLDDQVMENRTADTPVWHFGLWPAENQLPTALRLPPTPKAEEEQDALAT